MLDRRARDRDGWLTLLNKNEWEIGRTAGVKEGYSVE